MSYYDQAENLVQTVAPQGVKPLSNSQIAQARAYRDGTSPRPIYPAHSFRSVYAYTSHNQIRYQLIPDHDGPALTFFDPIGRLRGSQNAEQAKLNRYSQIAYDRQGRIELTYELNGNKGNWANFSATQYADWLTPLQALENIVATRYDEPYNSTIPTLFRKKEQTNLRGRIATIIRVENIQEWIKNKYVHATHYRYDVRGNVAELIQDDPELGPKRLEYAYDPIAQTVDTLIYQRDTFDQYVHVYKYDKELRLSEVLTGPSPRLLESDARYFYYDHGPLRREERGKEEVIGNDYAYAIDGKIKAMNGGSLLADDDMGLDAVTNTTHANFARDAVGFVEGYFTDATKGFYDYKAIGGGRVEPNYIGSKLDQAAPNLYNSNIRYEIQTIRPFLDANGDPTAYAYEYDQLQRLKHAQGHVGLTGAKDSWGGSTSTQDYESWYSYDANGNILSLKRNGAAAGGGGPAHGRPNLQILAARFYATRPGSRPQPPFACIRRRK